MKRKFVHFLMRTLALALALILTLGSLPLLSYAEETGRPEASNPAKPQPDDPNYTYSINAQIFFTVGEKKSDGKHRYGDFWPEWKDAIKGHTHSNTDLHTALYNDTTSHFYPVDIDIFALFDGAMHRFDFGSGLDTGFFGTDKISDETFFKTYIMPQIKSRVKENNPFKMIDHNKNYVILDPDVLFTEGYTVEFFRYANLIKPYTDANTGEIKSHNKIHIDVFIDRPDAGDIEILDRKPGTQEETKTLKDKIGRVIDLDKEGYKVDGYKRFVEVWNGTEYEPYDESNPIKFETDSRKFRISYAKSAIKVFEVIDGQLYGKPVEDDEIMAGKYSPTQFLSAEINSSFYFNPEIKDGAVIISKSLDGYNVTEDTVTIDPTTDNGHIIIVKYASKSQISIFEDLDGTQNKIADYEGLVGQIFSYTAPNKDGYKIIGIFLGDEKIADDKLENYTIKHPNYKFVVKYEKITPNDSNNNDNNGNNDNNNNNNNNNDNNNSNNSGDNEGNRERDEYREYNPDRDKNQGEVITDNGKTPLGPLEKFPFYAYLQGYPDGSVRPNAYVSRQETAAVFFRLLDATYRESIRSEENPFSDVDKSNWSNKHISTLAKGGIVRGYTDGTFRPKQIITRAELIEIASNFDAADGKVRHNFKSMNGELAPNTLVTRADFARIVNKVLGRNVKKSEIPAGVKQFTDLTPEMDFYEDMITATNSYNATKGDDAYQKWIELIPSNIEM